jgi:glycosyltransferase involved in cell wall biosynthesis
MACGTPVIGANVGGIKYSVVDRATGFLVPPNDPSVLAERLAVLAENRVLARAMGLAGMRRAREKFTWDNIAEQLALSYAEVARSPATQFPPQHSLRLTEAHK